MSQQLQVLNALDVAKTQWYHFTAIVIAGMGFFTDAYDLFCISLVTKLLGRIYYHVDGSPTPGSLPPQASAAVNGVAFVGTLSGQLFFGWLGDKMGRKRVYGMTLMIMVICSIASGLSFGHDSKGVMATLCFFRFWLGFGIGGDYPLSATIMSEYANKKTRGAFIAAVFAMQGVGILAGGMVAIADYVWRIILMFGSLPAALTYYWRMKMPETARYTALVAQNAKLAASDMSKEFLRRHGLHLLGTATTWFLLDIAFYSQNLFQKDIFTAIGATRSASGDLPRAAPLDLPRYLCGLREARRHRRLFRVPLPGAEPEPGQGRPRVPCGHRSKELALPPRRLQPLGLTLHLPGSGVEGEVAGGDVRRERSRSRSHRSAGAPNPKPNSRVIVLFGLPPPGTSSISTTSCSDRATIRFRTLLRRSGSGKCDLDRFLPRLPSTDPFLSFASALVMFFLGGSAVAVIALFVVSCCGSCDGCFVIGIWSWEVQRSGLRRRASGGSYRPMVVRARAKEIAFGQSSWSFLQAGIGKLADAVGVTLGPRGTFVSEVLDEVGNSKVVNGGVTIAQAIELADPKNEQIFICSLFCMLKKLVEELEKKARPVKGRGDIKGKLMILTSIEKRNKNLSSCSNTRLPLLCYIIVQLSSYTCYISPQLGANLEKLILEFENAKISVTDQKISTIKEIIPFSEKMTQLGALLLIIAEDVTARGLATLVVNKLAEHSQCCSNKITCFGDRRKAILQDIANFGRPKILAYRSRMYLLGSLAQQEYLLPHRPLQQQFLMLQPMMRSRSELLS
ncbi:unnamed protein product [Musa acuminata var. zebrina]